MANWRTIICVAIICFTVGWCVKRYVDHDRYEMVVTKWTVYKLDRRTGGVWQIQGKEQQRVTSPKAQTE